MGLGDCESLEIYALKDGSIQVISDNKKYQPPEEAIMLKDIASMTIYLNPTGLVKADATLFCNFDVIQTEPLNVKSCKAYNPNTNKIEKIKGIQFESGDIWVAKNE